MKLLLYGVSKNSASLQDLDHYILDSDQAQMQSKDLTTFEGVNELLILNSDFFTEYYFLVNEKKFQHGDFLSYLAETSGRNIEQVILETYSKFNIDLISHLLSLLSGLDYNKASSEMMDIAEDGLIRSYDSMDYVFLPQLFRQSISFVNDLQITPELQDVFHSKVDIILQEIMDQFKEIATSRFYLFGEKNFIMTLAKMLYRNGGQHISIASLERKQDADIVRSLNEWVKKTSAKGKMVKVFHRAKSRFSFLYYLSSADGIIFDQKAYEQCQEKYEQASEFIIQRLREFRHNRKRQRLFALNVQPEIWEKSKLDDHVYFLKEPENYGLASQIRLDEARRYFDRRTELEIGKLYKDYQAFIKEN